MQPLCQGIILIALGCSFIRDGLAIDAMVDKWMKDEMWPRLWIFNESAAINMNIKKAWALGATGKDVVIAVVDDGLQVDHPELEKNIDSEASYDFLGKDSNPTPQKNYSHGTRLAGIIAASGNNTKCGIGIAYGAKIGGIRMLQPGGITPATEARALAFGRSLIDIYSVSWGPGDDGIKVGKPTFLTEWALQLGALSGRNGKGSIYVWASGNGGPNGDHCGSDGYVNNPYTVAVSAAASNGRAPWYSERCAATFTSAVTSRTHSLYTKDFDLFTTDSRSRCVGILGATSTAAPMVASIIALGLQVNPSLTWRDIQHLLVVSSKPDHLQAKDWVRNGAGRLYSHWFGYGVLDAHLFVKNSIKHKPLPRQKICISEEFIRNYVLVGSRRLSVFKMKSNGCSGRIKRLEQVVLKITLAYRQRGMVSLLVRSPMGTKSIVLGPRRRDVYYLSYINWGFLSTHFWDENPLGTWEVTVRLFGRTKNRGRIYSAKLIFYGTS